MKQLIIFLFAFFGLLTSCGNNSNKGKTYEQIEEDEEKEHQAKIKQYADSIVSLSFKGIELGQPFTKTIQTAKKNGDIYDLKFENNKTSATCKAKLFLPKYEQQIPVDVVVASYQDTITSLMVMSDVYETRESLMDLYFDRYNKGYATKETNNESWYDNARRSCSDSWIWSFKNQTLRVTKFTTEERENYVKDPNMRSPQNRYGVRYTSYFKSICIFYNDIYQCNKVEEKERKLREEKEKEEEIEAKKKEKADSVKREKLKESLMNQDI